MRQKIIENSEEIKQGLTLLNKFRTMVREKQVDKYEEWLQEIKNKSLTEFENFAKGLKRDNEAVKNALSEVWSNGQVEGQVNRMKFIKRQMYGMANYNEPQNSEFIISTLKKKSVGDFQFGSRKSIYSNRMTISHQIGLRVPPAQVAALIKLVAPQFSVSNNLPDMLNPPGETGSLLSERKQQIRREINKLANRLANLLNSKPEEIHRKWIIEQNGTKNNLATEAELQVKFQWLKNEIIRIQQKRYDK